MKLTKMQLELIEQTQAAVEEDRKRIEESSYRYQSAADDAMFVVAYAIYGASITALAYFIVVALR